MSICATLTGCTILMVSAKVNEWKSGYKDDYKVWMGTSFGFLMIATFMTQKVSPWGEGSGIP